MQGPFTPEAANRLKQTFNKQEQSIVFQNRRGFAPFLQCTRCAWVPLCPNCDVSLTYYKYTNDMRCHYCGHRSKVYTECMQCKNTHMILKGAGTEKLEEDLTELMPGARIARMDSDTTRTRHKQNKMIADIENHQVDVVVGTQMVVKGLDFAHVNTVIVPDADQLFYFPDFRAQERGFQMLMQVSGRAGRRQAQGEVVIQAAKHDNPILNFVRQGDYTAFYNHEINERKQFGYPPYTRLIILELKHADAPTLRQAALLVYQSLSQKWGSRIYQPAEPAVNRIQNRFRVQVMIKTERDPGVLQTIKADIKKACSDMWAQGPYKQVQVIFDVDPY
jgi:primosomal protein N' (replication factor Y)